MALACERREGGQVEEALPLWRRDLPAPAAIASLADGSPTQRVTLASALAGRRGAVERDLLGRLMLDADREVRMAAAGALARSFGDRIAYDPDGSRASQEKAVRQLRTMHNRRP